MTKEQIKLVDQNEAVKAQKPTFKVTPVIEQLTPLGIKVLKNIGDVENAKQFMEWLYMDFGGETTNLHFLMAFLDAINKKVDGMSRKGEGWEHPSDFIDPLITHLFNMTCEHSSCRDAHLEALSSGNFIVKEIVNSSENEPDPVITQPLKAVA